MNNIRENGQGVTEVYLGENYWCKVNSDIWPRLSYYHWRPQIHRNGQKVYAQSALGTMHRFILGAQDGQKVDHRDGDGLNNLRDNLRVATPQQNSANRGRERNNVSGLKGVSWAETSKKWAALVVHKGKRYYLGVFAHKQRAAMAVDRLALALNGDYAGLNYPELRDTYRTMKAETVAELRART